MHLQGAPGIYSARFAGPEDATDADNNNDKLLQQLEGRQTRSAAQCPFFSCLYWCYMRHAEDPTPLICQGQLGKA